MTDAAPPIETDVVIVGAGPVGLFAVFQCGMLKMRCHVVDSLEAVGGQLSALYPEKPIYDIPGFPRVDALDLVHRLEEQAAPFHPVYHLGRQVTGVTRQPDDRFLVEAGADTRILARAVVIAAGAGAFGPNRPPLKGLEAFEGRSVFYLVRRREDFRGKRVVIAGGGDSAVDWAVSLAELAAHVAVVHRRDKFRAAPDMVDRLQGLAAEGRVELVIPYQLAGLDGADGTLNAVMVADMDGNERRLEADVLLPFFGLAAKLGPIVEWGLEIDRHLIRIDPMSCETTAPGIYAIGDITQYPGKLKLILQGFSEAAMAAHHMYGRVFPGQALHFEHSTTKGLAGVA